MDRKSITKSKVFEDKRNEILKNIENTLMERVLDRALESIDSATHQGLNYTKVNIFIDECKNHPTQKKILQKVKKSLINNGYRTNLRVSKEPYVTIYGMIWWGTGYKDYWKERIVKISINWLLPIIITIVSVLFVAILTTKR